MKRIAVLLLFLLSTCFIQAQILKELQNSTPQERASLFSKEISQKLTINTQQFEQISKINLEHAFNVVLIIEGSQNKIVKLKKIKNLDKKRDQYLAAIFKDIQLNKYLKHKKELIKNTRNKLKEVSIM